MKNRNGEVSLSGADVCATTSGSTVMARHTTTTESVVLKFSSQMIQCLCLLPVDDIVDSGLVVRVGPSRDG
jgi:hypothetical protein